MILQKLKAAFGASTTGKWYVSHGTQIFKKGDHRMLATTHGYQTEHDLATEQANAEFIALAHNAMPMLLEAVELLKMAGHALETPGDFTPEEMQEQVIGDIGAFLAKLEEECGGDNASGHTDLKKLYALWDQLGNIPTNNADEIEEAFLHFGVGTHREEIWHWFEAQNPRFVVGEVMSGVRPYPVEVQQDLVGIDDRREINADSSAMGFDVALKIVAEMLYAHLDEQTVVVTIDSLQSEYDALKARDYDPA